MTRTTNITAILADNRLDKDRSVWADALERVTAAQVEQALAQAPGRYSVARMVTLLSPAAKAYLEPMAQQARKLTIQRFGRTIQLYAPLYVSNVCVNSCRYCGYNRQTDVNRTRLTREQALADAEVIAAEGFRHLLLVSGEDSAYVTVDYLSTLAHELRRMFASIAIEIQPLQKDDYAALFAAGIDGVALYQETYDRDVYADYHVAGPKRDYDNRLETPDRYAAAGMRRIGLGVLLGLADWRLDTLAMAEHAAYLMKTYWRSQIDFSFPRIRPATNVIHEWPYVVSDEHLVQMMLALRLCFADTGIVLSTRELPAFRDRMMNICVTRVSAGSKTNPGGYASDTTAAEQFTVADERPPAEVAAAIARCGHEPVWKDWDAGFIGV
ncbi:MAG: 2-iminoacetate synthase ThiH [Phycisphaerae bacterium]|nr:2-iminoacetate synthase ThiH [Phycisphaerae bacterium]